ncbi:MAG: DUF2061 domain-containing protein [Pseudomonadota bacterium]|nr:DUF2061 domain-containing protein [Pseudomonadota bacterium]
MAPKLLGLKSHSPNDPRTKSALKTLTWRVLASTDTLIIAWVLTGSFTLAGSIMSVEIVTKMFLYYAHERVWSRYM